MPDLKISQLPTATSLNATDILPVVDNGSTKSATLSSLQYVIGVPTGAIMSFYLPGAPSGWRVCDGSAISNSGETAALFALIGATLPDLRGAFVRGSGTNGTYRNTSGSYLSGGPVGSQQIDAYGSHTHSITDSGHTHAQYYRNFYGTPYGGLPGGPVWYQGGNGTIIHMDLVNDGAVRTSSSTTGISIGSAGNNETRPANISLLYCIKL